MGVISSILARFGFFSRAEAERLNHNEEHLRVTLLSAKAERLARLYATQSQVNSMLVHAQSEAQIYKDVCHVLVDVGRFDGAMITAVDWEQRKTWPAFGAGGLRQYVTAHADTPVMTDLNAQSLSGFVFINGTSLTSNDCANDERIPLRSRELSRLGNVAAVSLVPLKQSGQTVAVLGVTSGEAGFFTEEITRLIEEIGLNVSYVLNGFAVAEQKRIAELAVERNEQLYSTLVRAAPGGIFQADAQGQIFLANASLLHISGVDASDLSAERWADAYHPDDRELIQQMWATAIQTKSGVELIHRFVRPDGSISWVQARTETLLDKNNNVSGYIGVVTDITAEHNQLRSIETLSHLYATLSRVSSIIAQVKTVDELFQNVCKAVVDAGRFEQASITLVDWDKRRTRQVFSYGPLATPSKYRERDLDAPETLSVSNLALIEGCVVTVNDYVNDERVSPHIRAAAKISHAHATTAEPIWRDGQIVGTISIASRETNFFTRDILDLIGEIARSVSFALDNLAQAEQKRLVEAVLDRNEERLRMGLSITKTGMYEVDYATEKIALDATCARLLNLGDEAIETDVHAIFNLTFGENTKALSQFYDEMSRGVRDSYSLDSPLPLTDGTMRWLRNYGAVTAERDALGRPVKLLGVITDVTANKALEERNRLAATVFDNSGEGILVTDANFKVVLANQAFTRITGYSQQELLGEMTQHLRSDHHDESFYVSIEDVVQKEGYWQGEVWRQRKNGESFPTLTSLSTVKNKQGEISHYVLQEIDISMQKAFEERITHLAYRDSLTDLPNRALLRDRIEQSIFSANRDGSLVALLFLDLDHFKNINDSLGHLAGDQLLKEIAQRLILSLREVDTVGRLGGDEFLIVLPGVDADAAAHVAQKLLAESVQPFVFDSRSLKITPSIGIALYPRDGADFDELLKAADTAMYQAKDAGRHAYRFYTPEMNQAVFQRMVLETSLHRAIENHEFLLYYQPKFNLNDQTFVGTEALIRWHQPEMGLISPAQFIPVAEESGQIEPIGKWVLEEACRQIKRWIDQGLPPLRVAVNFSARQFQARNIVELVTNALQKAGLGGEVLELEITESLLAKDMDYTLETLHALKKLGMHVAVDDFGTGYSSLAYLKRFPIDRLKIDQSFVRDLVSDADDRAIATAIVTLGHSLGMRVIAEGVETAYQMEILREIGCDEIQGYYLGRPMSSDAMTTFLKQNRNTNHANPWA